MFPTTTPENAAVPPTHAPVDIRDTQDYGRGSYEAQQAVHHIEQLARRCSSSERARQSLQQENHALRHRLAGEERALRDATSRIESLNSQLLLSQQSAVLAQKKCALANEIAASAMRLRHVYTGAAEPAPVPPLPPDANILFLAPPDDAGVALPTEGAFAAVLPNTRSLAPPVPSQHL